MTNHINVTNMNLKEQVVKNMVEVFSNDVSVKPGGYQFSYLLNSDGVFKFTYGDGLTMGVNDFIKNFAIVCVQVNPHLETDQVFVMLKIGAFLDDSASQYMDAYRDLFNTDYNRFRAIVGAHLTSSNAEVYNKFKTNCTIDDVFKDMSFVRTGANKIESVVAELIAKYKEKLEND